MEFIIFFVFLVLGLVFGTIAEKRHYKSILKREQELNHLPSITFGKSLKFQDTPADSQLVYASVVISIDAFKKFIAGLVNLVGGTLFSYETLLDRARREAILRLKESCPGAKIIINTRIETMSISKNSKNAVGGVEVLVYGTAIY